MGKDLDDEQRRLLLPSKNNIGPDQTGFAWLPIEDLVTVRFYPIEVGKILNGQAEDRLYLGDVN